MTGDGSASGGNDCFVIMPFSEQPSYATGHFKQIYDQIFRPAIMRAGFNPVRADDSKSADLIQANIIRGLVSAPIVLCDLSTRNPNVLFELGIRQAFDKPVVLVQEMDTPRIFDIAGIRCYDYRPQRLYDEVLEDQACIADALEETFEQAQSGKLANSLMSLLRISSAEPETRNPPNISPELQVMLRELSFLRKDIEGMRRYPPYIIQTDPRQDFRSLEEQVTSLEKQVESINTIREAKLARAKIWAISGKVQLALELPNRPALPYIHRLASRLRAMESVVDDMLKSFDDAAVSISDVSNAIDERLEG